MIIWWLLLRDVEPITFVQKNQALRKPELSKTEEGLHPYLISQ